MYGKTYQYAIAIHRLSVRDFHSPSLLQSCKLGNTSASASLNRIHVLEHYNIQGRIFKSNINTGRGSRSVHAPLDYDQVREFSTRRLENYYNDNNNN